MVQSEIKRKTSRTDEHDWQKGEEKPACFTVSLIAYLAIDQHPFPPFPWTLAIVLLHGSSTDSQHSEPEEKEDNLNRKELAVDGR